MQSNCVAKRVFLLGVIALAAAPWLVLAGPLELAGKKINLGELEFETASMRRNITGHAVEFTLENPTTSRFGDLVLEYKVFVRSSFHGAHPNAPTERIMPGEVPIEQLGPKENVTLVSRPFALSSRRLKSGWVYSNKAKPRSQESYVGYVAIVKNRKGERVAVAASSQDLLRDWDRKPQPVRLPSFDGKNITESPLTVEPADLKGGQEPAESEDSGDEQE